MKAFPDLAKFLVEHYRSQENKRLYRASVSVEKEGYMRWPRIRETLELAKRLEASKVGIAFCVGLSREAEEVSSLFEKWGFQVYSVCCKCGSIDKAELELGRDVRMREGFDPACNPMLQAELLNRAGTQFNILVGLCVGHDALFYRYSKAPVTTLIVKDRVTGHNPLIALYTSYHRRLIYPP